MELLQQGKSMIQKKIVSVVLGSLALAGAAFCVGRVTVPTHKPFHSAIALTIQEVPTPHTDTLNSSDIQVWVNPRTRVFHLPGTRWYGVTKGGTYMSEQEALAAGYRPSGRG